MNPEWNTSTDGLRSNPYELDEHNSVAQPSAPKSEASDEEVVKQVYPDAEAHSNDHYYHWIGRKVLSEAFEEDWNELEKADSMPRRNSEDVDLCIAARQKIQKDAENKAWTDARSKLPSKAAEPPQCSSKINEELGWCYGRHSGGYKMEIFWPESTKSSPSAPTIDLPICIHGISRFEICLRCAAIGVEPRPTAESPKIWPSTPIPHEYRRVVQPESPKSESPQPTEVAILCHLKRGVILCPHERIAFIGCAECGPAVPCRLSAEINGSSLLPASSPQPTDPCPQCKYHGFYACVTSNKDCFNFVASSPRAGEQSILVTTDDDVVIGDEAIRERVRAGEPQLPPLDEDESDRSYGRKLTGLDRLFDNQLWDVYRKLASSYRCRERQLLAALARAEKAEHEVAHFGSLHRSELEAWIQRAEKAEALNAELQASLDWCNKEIPELRTKASEFTFHSADNVRVTINKEDAERRYSANIQAMRVMEERIEKLEAALRGYREQRGRYDHGRECNKEFVGNEPCPVCQIADDLLS